MDCNTEAEDASLLKRGKAGSLFLIRQSAWQPRPYILFNVSCFAMSFVGPRLFQTRRVLNSLQLAWWWITGCFKRCLKKEVKWNGWVKLKAKKIGMFHKPLQIQDIRGLGKGFGISPLVPSNALCFVVENNASMITLSNGKLKKWQLEDSTLHGRPNILNLKEWFLI